MGLKNSPSIFQRAMNMVLQDVLGKFAYIYIDDIIIYSKTAEAHLNDISQILERLHTHGLRIKFSKVQLFKAEIEYLGFLVGRDGLKVNPAKTKAIQDFPDPTDVKGVQAFLGVVGYFRLFIPQFATKAKPLYALLKKDVPFSWGEDQRRAIRDFKAAMQRAPVLSLPDFSKEFILTTDASGYALGAVLTQEDELGRERLITCHSRTLKDAETRYSNYEREILAVLWGVEQNRSYLWGSKFVIRTDNNAIPYLDRSKELVSSRAIRWFIKLGEYNYRVEHRKGRTIAHADAFSRYPCDNKDKKDKAKDELTTAYLSPTWQSEELVPIIDEEEWRRAIKKTSKAKLPEGKEVIHRDGLIYIQRDDKEILWVPPSLRTKIIRLYHEPPSYGHRGAQAVANVMKETMIWSNLERDVRDVIKTCSTCQEFKNYGLKKKPIKTLPVPKRCFDEISLDVVGPVPTSSKGNNYILVMQDRLSRWIQFSPMSNTSAMTTSRTFLNDWVCVYGPPRKILTDRGTNFLASYFRELVRWLGIQPTNTVAYRPQANGQNERTHRELHNYLAMYLEDVKSRTHWDTLLRLAAWVHNSTIHEAMKASPYEIMTGMKPNTARMWLPGTNPDLSEDMLEKHFGIKKAKLEELRRNAVVAIEKAQAGYLARRDKKQSHQFAVGDLVWVKSHQANKWHAKYHGPYKVEKVVSESVIKIVLDEETGKSDYVHTDYIKPYYSRSGSPAVKRLTSDDSTDVNDSTDDQSSDDEDLDIEIKTDGHLAKQSFADKRPEHIKAGNNVSNDSAQPQLDPEPAIVLPPISSPSPWRRIRNFLSGTPEVPPDTSESEPTSENIPGVVSPNREHVSPVRETATDPIPSSSTRSKVRKIRDRAAEAFRNRANEISRADRALLEENRAKGLAEEPSEQRTLRSRRQV
jgi:hypothetical protein